MTVIAWDGKTIAADRQCSNAGMKWATTKLFRLRNGEVCGICGDWSHGMQVMAWYEDGAEPASFPDCRSDEDWARLVLLRADGLWTYERTPYPLRIEGCFMAFGAGADFAMGAMAMGADARRAVEVANQFSTGCGLGCDTMTFEKPAAMKAASARPRR